MAKREFKEKYNLTEEQMQDLITAAQDGDSAAQSELLEVFGNFLAKYVTLLYAGKYSVNDYDVRRFIGLFVKDAKLRYALLRNKMTPIQVKQVNEVLRGITYMAQRYGDEEDVEQTVRTAFMHCVSVYKKQGAIPFSGYLYSYFFYILKKLVDSYLIDQLGRKTFPLISDEDSGESDEYDEPIQGFTAPPTLAADEMSWHYQIDEDWVSGTTATFPFSELTIQERQLLKWRYGDKEKVSHIAIRITEHPNTIREHFNKIKEKIKELVQEE